jgi:hypothetical protein
MACSPNRHLLRSVHLSLVDTYRCAHNGEHPYLFSFRPDGFYPTLTLERSLTVERVRAGLRNARAKGKTLGRPRVTVDVAKIASLRSQGLSWAKIGEALGLGEGTVRRSAQASARNPSETAPANL